MPLQFSLDSACEEGLRQGIKQGSFEGFPAASAPATTSGPSAPAQKTPVCGKSRSRRISRRLFQAALSGAASLILFACDQGADPGAATVSGKKLECFRFKDKNKGRGFIVGFSNQEEGAEKPRQDSSAEKAVYLTELHPDRQSCEAKIREIKEARPDIH